MSGDRDWLTVGAEVAELQLRRPPWIRLAKVERFTKTLVILDNGQRYPLSTLRRRTASAWNPDYYLKPVSDNSVQAALRQRRFLLFAQTVEDLTTKLRSDIDPGLVVAIRKAAENLLAEDSDA